MIMESLFRIRYLIIYKCDLFFRKLSKSFVFMKKKCGKRTSVKIQLTVDLINCTYNSAESRLVIFTKLKILKNIKCDTSTKL